MPQRMVFTVEIDGTQYDIEGDRPPSEAEARAAIGLSAPTPQGRRASAKTGGAAIANDSPTIAPDWGAFFGHGFQSAVNTLNPMTYLNLAKSAVTDPVGTARNTLTGIRDTAGNLINGNFSAAMGDLAGPGIAGGVVRGVSAAARRSAVPMMELGLQRPRSAQLDFPNAAKRLVDENIVPRGNNVQRALDTAEADVSRSALTFDRQAAGMDAAGVPANMRLALPPAQGRVQIPGGSSLFSNNPAGQGVLMTDPTRVLRQAGDPGQAHLGKVVSDPMAPSAPQPGAYPGQVDPFKIADEARAFAEREGKMRNLGDKPGVEIAQLDAAKADYLSKNTRPRSQTETIGQKRTYQARSRYNNRVNAPTQTNESALFDKGVADANRRAAIVNQPEMEGMLAREQDLLGALTALENRAKSGPAFNFTSAARRAVLHPSAMGTLAIGAKKFGAAGQRLSPQMIRAGLAALMASHDAQNTK